jgi:dihydroorotase
LLALAALPCQPQEIYDVVLRGGHVIDPKNGRDQPLDIAIAGGRIRRIGSSIPGAQARRVVDLNGYCVTPGLIDLNAHLGAPQGVVADHNTLRFGVTTVVDAGSSGVKDFAQFQKSVIDPATVRILAFVNADGAPESVAQVIGKHSQSVVGIRATADSWKQSMKTAEIAKSVLLADSASGIPHLRPGDIATHVYGRSAPALTDILAARKKGILFDVGHGSEGLWFRVAVPAIKQGFLPDIISTGMDRQSILLPRTTMTNVMSKFLAMGLTLRQVIERTTVNPARAIRRSDLGSLEEGAVADIAVFEMRKGRFGFLDSGRARLTTDRELRCILTMREGKIVWDTEGLSLTDWKNAGPYSNFK